MLNRTNADWWNVRRANGMDGFVPANYVKEIEPKVVQVQVRKPEVVREVRRVKKTKMVLQNVTVKVAKSPRSTRKLVSNVVEYLNFICHLKFSFCSIKLAVRSGPLRIRNLWKSARPESIAGTTK